MKSMIRAFTATVFALSALLIVPMHAAAQNSVTVVDMAGRSVELKSPVKRVILAEANDFLSWMLIDPAPVEKLVGWAALRRFDTGTLDSIRNKFPDIDKVAVVGDWTPETFSVEKAVSLKPDLIVMTAFQDPKLGTGEFAKQFEAAGIPIVFITSGASTRVRSTEIAPRMRLLGKLFGREQQAEDYIAFYQSHLASISDMLEKADVARPKVLLETYAGLSECCRAPGRHGWSEFVELAGGQNLSSVAPSQAGGMLSMEYLLAQAPDIYVGNGGSYLHDKGLVIGPAYSESQTRASLQKLADRPGFKDLKAIKNRCAFAIWTALAGQPVNILIVEQFAKWFHPSVFRDLDPQATLDEINRRFAAVPMKGHYWLALDPDGCAR